MFTHDLVLALIGRFCGFVIVECALCHRFVTMSKAAAYVSTAIAFLAACTHKLTAMWDILDRGVHATHVLTALRINELLSIMWH